MKHNRPAGEPSGYCGVCGVPNEHCDCRQYKEHGVNATNAGSEHTDDASVGKNMKAEGNGGGNPNNANDNKKNANGNKSANNGGNGDKKSFPGAKPFGKKE